MRSIDSKLPLYAVILMILDNAMFSMEYHESRYFAWHKFRPKLNRFLYRCAALDENNHASFYEYDDELNLVRVKKETERGIVTIQENRQNIRLTE